MKCKRITVFDLDDTLVSTSAKIRVIDAATGREIAALTPSQFNKFEKDNAHFLNFDDFESFEILKQGKPLKTFLILQKLYYSGGEIAIVTARSSRKLISDFFLEHGIKLKRNLIFAVNDPEAGFTGHVYDRKKQAIEQLVEKGYNDLLFYDDYLPNLTAVKEAEREGVIVETVLVTKNKYVKTSS